MMNAGNRTAQKGVVLIVSLLILLVLSIISISAVSNTSMEERMSSNFQQDMVAFQAAESAIHKIIVSGDPGGGGTNANPFYSSASDPLVTAVNAGLNTTTTTVTANMDPLNTLPSTLVASSTVSYRGATQLCPGYGGGVNCLHFELNTDSAIGGAVAGPTHVQGIERPAPGL